MAYADSAIDYKWEITHLDVSQRLMTVKYDPADSTDSARPSVFLNHNVKYDEFTESDLTVIATDYWAERRVVKVWDEVIEALAENPSFDPDTLIGNSYSSRYKVRTGDSVPDINYLTQEVTFYDSASYDEIRTKYTVVALDASARADKRLTLESTRNNFWLGLQKSDYLGTASTALSLSDSYGAYNNEDVNFLTSDIVTFGDSVSTAIQTAVGLNDSDWANWILTQASGKSGVV